jgi:predicted XRE-type DNA-binding protein
VTEFAPDAVSSFFDLRQHYADVAARLGVRVTAKRPNQPMLERDLRSLVEVKKEQERAAKALLRNGRPRKKRAPDIPLPAPRVDTGEFRPIAGVPHYLISDLGEVRHVDRAERRNPMPNSRGYLQFSYRLHGTHHCECLHDLVAEAFLGPRPKGAMACFLDGDKTNVRASNLAYLTWWQCEDRKRARGATPSGTRNGNCRFPEHVVIQVRAAAASRKISQRQLARRFGISQQQISNILNFKQRAQ